jgi:superfamily I DNA and/or RNA helicase
LIQKRDVIAQQIGIISPYTYQTRTIISMMSTHKPLFHGLTVNSVERFQGSERECIIMTSTRTNGIGFMGDDLRVNTSLTRAKKLLIIVGNERALKQHPAWARFIFYCQTNGALKEWTHISNSFY